MAKRHKCKPKKSNLQTALKYLEAVAFQANALLGVGLLHFMKRNILKAAYYVRKVWYSAVDVHFDGVQSWKHWENAEELLKCLEGLKADVPPRLKGYVCFGVGFFYFFVSLTPSHLMVFVKVLGFTGDRSRAVDLLHVAQDIEQVIAFSLSVSSLTLQRSVEDPSKQPLLFIFFTCGSWTSRRKLPFSW